MENNFVKEEWINGVIMMSPRPQYNHMEVMDALGTKLKLYFNNKCKVAIENALFLTEENPSEIKKDLNKLKALIRGKGAELVPDIAVFCDKEQIFKRGFLGIPQLVVEVISPSNAEDDTVKKRAIYEQFGVPEYWIASPLSKKVLVLNLEQGKYVLKGEYSFLEENIKSTRFDDLDIDIRDIYLLENDEFDI